MLNLQNQTMQNYNSIQPFEHKKHKLFTHIKESILQLHISKQQFLRDELQIRKRAGVLNERRIGT